ncbi:MAG: hypothetical protein IJ587_03120 [Synergistaceae bacterium]|nr:hypothetical protein [Synergistaceae bacterium]
MLWKSSMLLASVYLLYFSDVEEEMSRGKAGKAVRIFRDVGIVFACIGSIIYVVKELASIPWGEWVSNGVVSHMLRLLGGIILFPLGLFLMSVFNAIAMYCLHKLWPDDYDEWGHHRKSKPGE